MSYESALIAAGAKILEFGSFGTYQGEWYAFVEYEGQLGWVEGSYGSCTECDSFQSEFGYGYDRCEEHEYYSEPIENCPDCAAVELDYDTRLKSFGESYLPPADSSVNILAYLDEAEEWDDEPGVAAAWIREIDKKYQSTERKH